MYDFIWFCFVLLRTLYCVEGNSVNPWSYFNNPGKFVNNLNTDDASRIVQISQAYFPEFSQSFISRSDESSWPRIETGFVPSFGNLANVHPAQYSNILGYATPLQTSGQYWGPHRNVDALYHKEATNQVPTYTNKYHQAVKGYPTNVKHIFSINKPNFSDGSRLSQLRDDPLYYTVKSNVHSNEKRLKKKEKYPNGDIYQQQQNEHFEPQYEKYSPRRKPNCKNKPLKHAINYDKIQQKNRYPLPNYGHVKIYPNAYNPLKSNIDQLKSNQRKTFSEGVNDYPENKSQEKNQNDEEEILSGGQDIFDTQNIAFDNKKENFNGDFFRHKNKYHPDSKTFPQSTRHEEDDDEEHNDADTDFVPIKTYAQVRHTETTKHLPRESAYEDAETFDEVLNAPRLREAVKTSKAQTVYTEEGYEDAAYDHAGHLKHASNHENYAGYSKDKQDGGRGNAEEDDNGYGTEGKSKRGYDLSKGKKWGTKEDASKKFNNAETVNLKEEEEKTKFVDLAGAGSAKLSSNNISNKKNISKNITDKKVPSKIDSTQINPTNVVLKKKQHVDLVNSDDSKKKELPNKETVTKNLKKDKKRLTTKQNLQSPINTNVEVFDTGFAFNKGPKHGGNYYVHPTLYNYPKNNEKLQLMELDGKNNNENSEAVNVKEQSKIIGDPEFSGKVFELEENKSLPYKYNNSEERLEKTLTGESDNKDQYPLTSEVEVFKSDFVSKNRPKHGGNYRRSSDFNKKSNQYSELEDLETPEKYLHGGNYKIQKMQTAGTEIKGEETIHEPVIEDSRSMEEDFPSILSIINNIAFLTSNMTVPNIS